MMPRLPDEIMTDFQAGCQGTADIDMTALLWEIIQDVMDSYWLAMKNQQVSLKDALNIQDTVVDYLANNYGDD